MNPAIPTTTKKPRSPSLCLEEKLSKVLEACSGVGLSWAEVQYEMYRLPSSREKEDWEPHVREKYTSRRTTVAHFLQGRTTYTVSSMLDLWIRHPYGRPHKDSSHMFSGVEKAPYLTIGPVRPAMTSFAVQVAVRELVLQAEQAVQPEAGLHVHIPTAKRPEKKNVAEVDWRDIGKFTGNTISKIHRRYQWLLRYILVKVMRRSAKVKPQSRNVKIVSLRFFTLSATSSSDFVVKVADDIISKMVFTRSPFARLPALMKGLFHFASNASFDTFRYESRVGNTPAYSTVLRSLYGLSSQASKFTVERARDLLYVVWIIMDNVQNYHRRRMTRIGLQNTMNVGMAGTAWIRPLRHPNALNYEDKERRRASSRRDQLTVDSLLRKLDGNHERRVFSYQWLWVLGHYVSSLEPLKQHANMLLRTRGMVLKVEDCPTMAFPLPTSSGSETNLPELMAAIFDFLKSTGQTSTDFLCRMLPLGGDGLTFELLLKMLRQRQFHSSPFTSMRLLNPLLQWWHTLWTNDSRIIDKHLISYASLDPSTLGHSASKIDRTIRIDQGKYDYHQGSELLYFVLDMRMLDCWR